jgi:hypothetical protein
MESAPDGWVAPDRCVLRAIRSPIPTALVRCSEDCSGHAKVGATRHALTDAAVQVHSAVCRASNACQHARPSDDDEEHRLRPTRRSLHSFTRALTLAPASCVFAQRLAASSCPRKQRARHGRIAEYRFGKDTHHSVRRRSVVSPPPAPRARAPRGFTHQLALHRASRGPRPEPGARACFLGGSLACRAHNSNAPHPARAGKLNTRPASGGLVRQFAGTGSRRGRGGCYEHALRPARASLSLPGRSPRQTPPMAPLRYADRRRPVFRATMRSAGSMRLPRRLR